jgi:predicted nucleic acid-binding protein
LSLYLDASLLVALLQDEDESEAAVRIVSEAGRPLLVSDFARGEVASALARLLRMGVLTEAAARDRLDALAEWTASAAQPIETTAADVRLAAQLVSRFALGLRMPDAVHLAACQIRGLALGCFDRRLAVAAGALGVEVIG